MNRINTEENQQLSQIIAAASQAHSAMSELVELTAQSVASEAWSGTGFRSPAHWLSVVSGYDWSTCSEIVRVGLELPSLPKINAAFSSGSLSFDKVRSLTKVATPTDEDMWMDVARHASGSQFTRIARAFIRATEERADNHNKHGVSWWFRDDGMLSMKALLAPEDGAVLIAAIEQQRGKGPEEPAGETSIASLRADALLSLCAPANNCEPTIPARLVIHLDADRVYIEDGPSIATATARRIGCDAEVVTVTERDGSPLGVGRARRLVTGRLRAALQMRDLTCRFPGCCVPASKTHAHHIQHWMDDGETKLTNLVSLCGFHHRRLHDGEFQITENGFGIHFATSEGHRLVPHASIAGGNSVSVRVDLESPLALDGSPITDFDYAISVLSDAARFATSRASPW